MHVGFGNQFVRPRSWKSTKCGMLWTRPAPLSAGFLACASWYCELRWFLEESSNHCPCKPDVLICAADSFHLPPQLTKRKTHKFLRNSFWLFEFSGLVTSKNINNAEKNWCEEVQMRQTFNFLYGMVRVLQRSGFWRDMQVCKINAGQ